MKKHEVATTGHEITVTKNNSLHTSIPGQITRLLDHQLKAADLPHGTYVYNIDGLSAAGVIRSQDHGIKVESTEKSNCYTLMFQLSGNKNATYIGTLNSLIWA